MLNPAGQAAIRTFKAQIVRRFLALLKNLNFTQLPQTTFGTTRTAFTALVTTVVSFEKGKCGPSGSRQLERKN